MREIICNSKVVKWKIAEKKDARHQRLEKGFSIERPANDNGDVCTYWGLVKDENEKFFKLDDDIRNSSTKSSLSGKTYTIKKVIMSILIEKLATNESCIYRFALE